MLAVKFVGIGVTCGGWKGEMRGLDAIVLTAVERGGWHWMALALAASAAQTPPHSRTSERMVAHGVLGY
jgi:ABC-type sugar transport system substrate-binding protein